MRTSSVLFCERLELERKSTARTQFLRPTHMWRLREDNSLTFNAKPTHMDTELRPSLCDCNMTLNHNECCGSNSVDMAILDCDVNDSDWPYSVMCIQSKRSSGPPDGRCAKQEHTSGVWFRQLNIVLAQQRCAPQQQPEANQAGGTLSPLPADPSDFPSDLIFKRETRSPSVSIRALLRRRALLFSSFLSFLDTSFRWVRNWACCSRSSAIEARIS